MVINILKSEMYNGIQIMEFKQIAIMQAKKTKLTSSSETNSCSMNAKAVIPMKQFVLIFF